MKEDNRKNIYIKPEEEKEIEDYIEDKDYSFSSFAREAMKEKMERDEK